MYLRLGLLAGGVADTLSPCGRNCRSNQIFEPGQAAITVRWARGGRQSSASPLLPDQRCLSLSGPGVRRVAVRARRGARGGVAADRVRGGHLRRVAAPVADVSRPGPQRASSAPRVGRGAGGDERVLLHGDRSSSARDGRGDRVLAGNHAGGAGRALPAQRGGARAGRSGRVPRHQRAAHRAAVGTGVCLYQCGPVRAVHSARRPRRQTPGDRRDRRARAARW